MDNLQSMTYQTFEQDPVKYRNYEEVRLSPIKGAVDFSSRPGNLPCLVRMAI